MAARVASLSPARAPGDAGAGRRANPTRLIAREYDISPRTVEVYRANVMTKMQAGSLSELVRFAIRAGVVEGLSQVNSGNRQTGYLVGMIRRPQPAPAATPRSPPSARKPMIYVVDDDYDVLGHRCDFCWKPTASTSAPSAAAPRCSGLPARNRRGLPCRRLQDGGNRRSRTGQPAAKPRRRRPRSS